MAIADKVFTKVDLRLNQIFGPGPKGSITIFSTVLIISVLLRLIFITDLQFVDIIGAESK